MFHISPKPLPPGAVIRSRPFLPDARVFSSVAGGVHFVPFSSSGADGVRESACHHVSPFGASNHPIIRRLTMELGGGHYQSSSHPRNLHSEIGTCRYTLSLSGACHTFCSFHVYSSPQPQLSSHKPCCRASVSASLPTLPPLGYESKHRFTPIELDDGASTQL